MRKGGSAKGGRGTTKTARKSVRPRAAKGAKQAPKRTILTVVRGGAGRGGRLAPVVRFAIKALDPVRKCGPGTSVQFLYRVDEQVEGKTRSHLVFFDRHGWYCEHGRTCPAVAPARKHNGHIARVS